MPSPTLLQRFKERKLVPWATAYLAVALAIVGLMEGLADPWGISPQIQRTVHLLLSAGFLVTLTLAWYHGEKGRQHFSRVEILLLAGYLVGTGLALKQLGPPKGGWSAAAGDPRPGIAVLPCDDHSPDPADAVLASSLHDEILLKLGAISSLRSFGRTTMEWYREQGISLPAIADSLGVGFIAECSVQVDRTMGQIRLRFQLMDRTGVQISVLDSPRTLTSENLYRVQSEIAQEVAYQLRSEISPGEREWLSSIPTRSLEAYEAYLRGMDALHRERQGGLTGFQTTESIERLEESIALDPSFALAHARLAFALTFAINWGGNPDRVRMLSQRALTLEPTLNQASVPLARWLWREGQGAEALELLSLAAQKDPNDAWIALDLAAADAERGRHQSAIHALETAEARDPMNPLIPRRLQYLYIFGHRYDDALAAIDREAAASAQPHPMSFVRRAWVYLLLGDSEAADRNIEEVLSRAPWVLYNLTPWANMRVVERVLSPSQRGKVSAAWPEPGHPYVGVSEPVGRALHFEATGGSDAARTHWDSARMALEAPSTQGYTGPQNRILIWSGLGDREEALTEARALANTFEGCRVGMSGAWEACQLLAQTLARFGEDDQAIDLLEVLLPVPSWLTVHILEIDPIWAPLRNHPRFQALLEKYADEVEH